MPEFHITLQTLMIMVIGYRDGQGWNNMVL